MVRLLGIGIILGLLACGPAPEFDPQQVMRFNDAGVAIDGYSPVSHFQRGVAEAGSAEFAARHGGLTYWLTDAEQLAIFEAAPDKYVPAHGGWCSLMLTGSGRLTPANPETFKIVDDKLLLFWSGRYKDMDISGRKNWDGKFMSAETEREAMSKADRVWEAISTGDKKARIILFNSQDRERVAKHHRAIAKQK